MCGLNISVYVFDMIMKLNFLCRTKYQEWFRINLQFDFNKVKRVEQILEL